MFGMRRTPLIHILLAAVVAVFAVASVVFVAQGGFAGGHGRFDRMIGLLALPWVLVPWPESLWVSDYIMLVLLPLGCNLIVILVVWRILAGRR